MKRLLLLKQLSLASLGTAALMLFGLAGCSPQDEETTPSDTTPPATLAPPEPTATATPMPTPTPTLAEPTPTASPTLTPAASPDLTPMASPMTTPLPTLP